MKSSEKRKNSFSPVEFVKPMRKFSVLSCCLLFIMLAIHLCICSVCMTKILVFRCTFVIRKLGSMALNVC